MKEQLKQIFDEKADCFLQYALNIRHSKIDGEVLYDVVGHYKYMTLAELYTYWCIKNNYNES